MSLMLTTAGTVCYLDAAGLSESHHLPPLLMKSPYMDGSSVIESPQPEEEGELPCSRFCGDFSVLSPGQDLSDVNYEEAGQNLAKAPHQKASREPGSSNNCVPE